MTEIAFHFNVPQTLPYVCRLLRKAVNAGSHVLVTGPTAVLNTLDRELWTFAPLEFVAHCTADAPGGVLAASPVVLAPSIDVPQVQDWHCQVLLNLGDSVPEGFERFARLIEVVSYDEADIVAARQRWRTYAKAGFSMTRHDLAAASS